MSLKKHLAFAALLGCGAQFALADTLQLKDTAAVTGKILEEKSDAFVVDLGYTVLVIPRSAITGITRSGTTAAATTLRLGGWANFMPPTPGQPPRAT
jgi:hypothetical protein